MAWVRVGLYGVCACVLLAVYVYAAVWIVRRADAGNARAAELHSLEEKYSILLERERSVRATESAQRRLDSLFLNKKNVANFLGNTELLGRSLGLEVSTTFLGAVKDELSVEIRATGAFGELVRYAGLLEQMPYRISLTRFSLSGARGVSWQASYTVSIKSFE